jgi:hypothetical protein
MASADIRDQLRKDHDTALAELDALRKETDPQRCLARLANLRRSWMIHALAEETVVYKALEAAEIAAGGRTEVDARFVEHELVEGLFDQLAHGRPGTQDWQARLDVIRYLIARHIETEHDDMLVRLTERFDATALREMGHRFDLTGDKLTMLEEIKAAPLGRPALPGRPGSAHSQTGSRTSFH